MPIIKKIISHNAIKSSIFNKFQWATKSALDKNLSASANSINPRQTFIVFNQLPDFGICSSTFGNIANKAKGKPNAKPKPAIPAVNSQAPESPLSDPARSVPKIGPVHENETIAKVNAIKNIPIKPDFDSLLTD